jgi:lambda family phage minor tail protein L
VITLSDAAKLEKNKLSSSGVWIILIELQFGDTSYRVCKNNEDIVWGGNTYVAFPMELDAKTDSSKGEIPSFIIRLSNVNRLMQSYAEQADGAVGKNVIVRLVHSEHLDLVTPEVEENFTITDVNCDSMWVYITLSILNPFLMEFPRQRFLKNFCRFKFKGIRCKYTGADTECNHTLSDCKAKGNAKRFGGFAAIPLGGIYK